MRALFLNDYCISTTYQRATADIDHIAHTWGFDYFSDRTETAVAPFNFSLLDLQRKLKTYALLGDIAQQLYILKQRKRIDVVVAANFSVIGGLGYLRRLVDIPPTIGVVHSLPRTDSSAAKRLLKLRMQGADRIVCIAKKDYDYLVDGLGIERQKIVWAPWSANVADFTRARSVSQLPLAAQATQPYIISMGKTQRDYKTLVKAFVKVDPKGWHLRIYAPGFRSEIDHPRIHISHNWIPFKDSIALYDAAEIVVVPMVKSERTLGLTSLYDAMATGKPSIVTRNPGIDVDIEKENLGCWVDAENIDDMAKKIYLLTKNPNLRSEMGSNGIRYLDQIYSYGSFCERLYATAMEITKNSSKY